MKDTEQAPLCACGCGQAVTSHRRGQWCHFLHGHNYQGKHHTPEERARMSLVDKARPLHVGNFQPGPANPMFKDGLTPEREKHRPNWWYRGKLREQILERDGRACVLCGSTNRLHVHHIDGNCGNNDSDNLQAICASCHWQVSHA